MGKLVNVFISSLQIILENKGDIDANYSYSPSRSNFGDHFTFTPSQGIIGVGESQAIKVPINNFVKNQLCDKIQTHKLNVNLFNKKVLRCSQLMYIFRVWKIESWEIIRKGVRGSDPREQ